MRIGYARISTDDQNMGLQLDALRAAGCDEIYEDRASGANADREGLTLAIARCGPGDVLVTWKLDRLGRSIIDLIALVDRLKSRCAGLKVLTGHGASIDTTRPEGRFILGVFASLAEFERELIRERTRAGMQAAKARGRHVGRPRKLTPQKLARARELIAAGAQSRTSAAAVIGVDVSTLRRGLRGIAS